MHRSYEIRSVQFVTWFTLWVDAGTVLRGSGVHDREAGREQAVDPMPVGKGGREYGWIEKGCLEGLSAEPGAGSMYTKTVGTGRVVLFGEGSRIAGTCWT